MGSKYYLFLLPFSFLYGLIILIIKITYSLGFRKIYSFPLPIVAVGNITSGGTGKTPLVLWLVKKLKQNGWNVGVVSRGYGRKFRTHTIIVDKNTHSNECGDEPLLIWKRTGALVAVSSNRAYAVKALLLKKQKLDIIIMDDGLQHYALTHDISLVVIDGDRKFGNGWLLPAGPMREFITKLNTVHGIIVNGGTSKTEEISMKLKLGDAINLLNGNRCILSCLQEVVAVAGIGNPSRFFNSLRSSGVHVIKEISFLDHQIYNENMLSSLIKENETLLMTEKDAVKCSEFAHENWWYVEVDAILSDTQKTKNLLQNIELCIKNYQKK